MVVGLRRVCVCHLSTHRGSILIHVLSVSPFSVKGLGGGVAAGLDPGGDDSWTSSGDRHAIGESKCFPLLKVVKDTSKFCLGCIGLDSRQFCWSTACRVVLHRPKRCTFCHVRRGISSVPQGKG
jgi:hypothetical protein